MKKCVLVVFSNPVPGRESEYNEWYDETHLSDVLEVPGFLSAQRFTLGSDAAEGQWKYLAIYEFEADDPANALAELTKRAGTADMVLSESMDLTNYSATPWVAIGEKLTAQSSKSNRT